MCVALLFCARACERARSFVRFELVAEFARAFVVSFAQRRGWIVATKIEHSCAVGHTNRFLATGEQRVRMRVRVRVQKQRARARLFRLLFLFFVVGRVCCRMRFRARVVLSAVVVVSGSCAVLADAWTV